MERDAEEAAFRRVVHAEIENRRRDDAVIEQLDPACVLFENEHLLAAEERDANRRFQP
jgi:hypothetical protein